MEDRPRVVTVIYNQPSFGGDQASGPRRGVKSRHHITQAAARHHRQRLWQ